MKPRRSSVSVAATAFAAVLTLSACGASAPPSQELADEMIETIDFGLDPDADADAIERARACYETTIRDFDWTDDGASGFSNLDAVAEAAASGQGKLDDSGASANLSAGEEIALDLMAELETELVSCNP